MVEYEERQKAAFTVLVSSLFYKCLHPEQDIRLHMIEIDNEKMSALLFTSGTTAQPKGVMLSQKNICYNTLLRQDSKG